LLQHPCVAVQFGLEVQLRRAAAALGIGLVHVASAGEEDQFPVFREADAAKVEIAVHELPLVGAIQVHRPDLLPAGEDQPFPVTREAHDPLVRVRCGDPLRPAVDAEEVDGHAVDGRRLPLGPLRLRLRLGLSLVPGLLALGLSLRLSGRLLFRLLLWLLRRLVLLLEGLELSLVVIELDGLPHQVDGVDLPRARAVGDEEELLAIGRPHGCRVAIRVVGDVHPMLVAPPHRTQVDVGTRAHVVDSRRDPTPIGRDPNLRDAGQVDELLDLAGLGVRGIDTVRAPIPSEQEFRAIPGVAEHVEVVLPVLDEGPFLLGVGVVHPDVRRAILLGQVDEPFPVRVPVVVAIHAGPVRETDRAVLELGLDEEDVVPQADGYPGTVPVGLHLLHVARLRLLGLEALLVVDGSPDLQLPRLPTAHGHGPEVEVPLVDEGLAVPRHGEVDGGVRIVLGDPADLAAL